MLKYPAEEQILLISAPVTSVRGLFFLNKYGG